jgi:hypothetical protein
VPRSCRNAHVAQARDLRAWRRAGKTAVFAAELRSTLIADAMAGGAFVVRLGDVQLERLYGILRERPVSGARYAAASMAAIDA